MGEVEDVVLLDVIPSPWASKLSRRDDQAHRAEHHHSRPT